MVEIADCHKELLRTLVKLRREGSIPEEFSVTLLGSPEVRRAGGGLIAINGLSSLSLEALTRAGLIFSISYHLRNVSGTTGVFNSTTEHEYESSRDCYITPAGFRAVDSDFAAADDILMRRPPVELTASLAAFRADFPDPSRLAFVMMRFGETPAHDRIWEAIRHALDPLQFVALRADGKEYHESMLWNILTYIYGCRFGIAVFERIEDEAFNPNVALEVGYMMGLGKPVCYLKERTLRTLHTDLVGQLYREFDVENCEETVRPTLLKWMDDKGLITRQVERKAVAEAGG